MGSIERSAWMGLVAALVGANYVQWGKSGRRKALMKKAVKFFVSNAGEDAKAIKQLTPQQKRKRTMAANRAAKAAQVAAIPTKRKRRTRKSPRKKANASLGFRAEPIAADAH